ncbi:MAG: Ig-like domain-containing protein [Muribaculaceae bacterium]|nr:Ig-like domain-containing protein [Muribaculaceae bacterium]
MKKYLLMAMCMVAVLSASANDTFYINDFTINPGETKEIEINLDNDTVYTALQADIYLPEGLTIEQEDGDYLFDLTDRKGRNHTISSTLLSSGAIRILIASQTLKTFSGNSGALVVFNIIADNSFSGSKTIELKNVIASEVDQTEHHLPNTTCTVTQEGYVPPVGDGDIFYINDFSINPSETKEVEIMLDNETVFTALQADIYLPDGLTIEQEDGDYLFELTDRKGRNHTISSTLLSSGAIRILIASQTLKTFSGNSGALVTFNIIADNSFSGPKVIELKNVIAREVDQTEHHLPNTSCTVTGGGSTGPVNVTSLMTTSCEIPKGIKVKFNVGVNPANANNPALQWSSSNENIAIVDANGTIETLEMGTVTITASTTDGSNIAINYVINVTEAQQSGNSLDVDGDGVVTSADITMIYNYMLGN